MTSILIFIMPGTPGQLFTGAMIAFVFLILNLHIRPFCTGTTLPPCVFLFGARIEVATLIVVFVVVR
jgi:hypothetical protein